MPETETATLPDSAAYRRALGHFTTGVAVITTAADIGPIGLTVNSFTSVSLEPPLILWSLTNRSPHIELFGRVEYFAVNVLAHDQTAVAEQFSQRVPDRFAGIEQRPGVTAAPLIGGAIAHLECRLVDRIVAGDHHMILGEVIRFTSDGRAPLVFSRGRLTAWPHQPPTEENPA